MTEQALTDITVLAVILAVTCAALWLWDRLTDWAEDRVERDVAAALARPWQEEEQ